MWCVFVLTPRVHALNDARSISDADGPAVAHAFYEALFVEEVIDADAVAYALDAAVFKLRREGASSMRWASFIHVGA
jgi:hypothetical protein